VPDDLTPPADLEGRVARFRRRRRRGLRLGALGVAAAIVTSVLVFASVGRDTARPTIGIESSDSVSRIGALKGNVVMIDARGPYVVALDAAGHQVDTLVVTHRGGRIVDAQVTADHETLWYLYLGAHGLPGIDCGNVVRADIGTGESRIVASAVSFGISADGATLALAGRGNVRDDKCRSMSERTAPGSVALLDVAQDEKNEIGSFPVCNARRVDSLRFAPSGTLLEVNGPSADARCVASAFNELPRPRLSWLAEARGQDAAFGADGLYAIEGPDIVRYGDPIYSDRVVVARAGAHGFITQVVPTRAGTFVVTASGGLFRVERFATVRVRNFSAGEYGSFTPVLP
jgi:hypothetical protein